MLPNRRQAFFPPALVFLLLCSGGSAHCQTNANLALLSAYTGRGVALDTRPVPQLRIEHDAAGGWYAGGFASPVRLGGRSQGQLIAYGGRAQRLSSTLIWDAGVTRTIFLRDRHFDYSEFYAGLMLSRANVRLLYSPAYYGEGRTVYLDLNHTYPLGENLTLGLHAGQLHFFGDHAGSARNSRDLRLSLSSAFGDYRVQAAWQTQWHPYLDVAEPAPALTVGVSRQF
jgi:uncharacterized protein (TIGR02001 family)